MPYHGMRSARVPTDPAGEDMDMLNDVHARA